MNILTYITVIKCFHYAQILSSKIWADNVLKLHNDITSLNNFENTIIDSENILNSYLSIWDLCLLFSFFANYYLPVCSELDSESSFTFNNKDNVMKYTEIWT